MANLTNEQIEQLLALLASAGIDRTIVGKVMPLHKGEYDPLVIYAINDIVSYHGSSYWKYNPVEEAGIIPVDETVWRQLTDASAVEEYVERAVLAANRAETAQTGAETAQAAAEDAEEGAQAAQTAAEAAQTAAENASETAQGYAGDASASASGAAQSAQDAENAATGAQASATTASNAAVSASASAADATSSATDAYTSQQAAEAAQEAAEAAEDGAESAVTDAVAAKDAAVAAKTAAETAKTDAIAAKTAAETAQAGAESAEDGAEAAQAAAEAAAALVADMALMEAIAPKYSSTTAYKVGNLLTYLGKQYYCIADAPAGTLPTNTTYFEEKSVADIIEMIKQGAIVTGHSQVADNLTPYSEDSGTTQENPFISQGTGTDNNSVIVTTGAIARQLEKQGNTIVVNEWVSALRSSTAVNGLTFTNNNDGTLSISGTCEVSSNYTIAYTTGANIKGHKYLFILGIPSTANYKLSASNITPDVGKDGVIVEKGDSAISWGLYVYEGAVVNIKVEPHCVDLTQMFNGNSNIPADLLANPSHFSWYYNGSLAYDAGSLQNCNGRYLECGQGRNLFDQQTEDETIGTAAVLVSKNIIRVIPNTKLYFWIKIAGYVHAYGVYLKLYDAHGNVIQDYTRTFSLTDDHIYTVPANVWAIKFGVHKNYYGNVYNNDISIELYYTPSEGGEGYGEMHDYVAPIRIDTGNETLKAFDKKLPSGVIERGTASGNIGDLIFIRTTEQGLKLYNTPTNAKLNDYNFINNLGLPVVESFDSTSETEEKIQYSGSSRRFYILLKSTRTGDDFTWQYELNDASKTTEQGTPYSEYADINDYSYMCWLDTDGNLVSIPQGCKLFYPVDYKGFVDDLVMYTNGDATALAKEEDITDSALNARGYVKMQDLLTAFGANGMVGGTLRQLLANKESLEFENTGCVNMSNLSFVRIQEGTEGFYYFRADISNYKGGSVKILSTMYSTKSTTGASGLVDMQLAGSASQNQRIYVRDDSCTTVEAFVEKVTGQLVAYEKAST